MVDVKKRPTGTHLGLRAGQNITRKPFSKTGKGLLETHTLSKTGKGLLETHTLSKTGKGLLETHTLGRKAHHMFTRIKQFALTFYLVHLPRLAWRLRIGF